MSLIVEAIVVPLPKDEVSVLIPKDLELIVREFSPTVTIVFLEEDFRGFTPDFSNVANELSYLFNRVLLIQFDDRVGYRASEIHEAGRLVLSFGPDDETWVEMDREYKPMTSKGIFKTNDRPKRLNAEWANHENAIQLGIKFMGLSIDWEDVIDMVYDG